MKNWKNNRGRLLNKKNNLDNNKINLLNLYNYDFKKFLQKEINIKRIIDLEFSKINYIDNKGIKKYFRWKKMQN